MSVSGLLSVFFPRSCVGCGQWDYLLCPRCEAILCPQRKFPPWRIMPLPGWEGEIDVPHWAIGEYAGELREFVLAAKHRPDIRLERYLLAAGDNMGTAMGCSKILAAEFSQVGRVWVVPAPSRFRRRYRGQDVALPLAVGVARGLSERLGIRTEVVEAFAVKWGRGSQSGLAGAERRRGRQGAFRLLCSVPEGVGLLFVDDIVTTGATIQEMSRCVGRVPSAVASICWVSN